MNFASSFKSIGFDNSLNIESYLNNLDIEINEMDDFDMSFEIKDIDAPIANALRRIILSEVPTMAIEKVVLTQNTSVLAVVI